MPVGNPKHQKKKVMAVRKAQYSGNYKYLYRYMFMGLIFVGAVVAVVVLVTNLDTGTSDTSKIVETYDEVIIHYKLWIDDDRDGKIDAKATNIYQESETFSTNVTDTNLIKGFYKQLLGMQVGGSKFFDLEPNVDADGDGIDDVTNKEVLSYGSPSSQLFNMTIKYWIQIMNISKASQNIRPSSSLAYSMQEIESQSQVLSVRNLFIPSFL